MEKHIHTLPLIALLLAILAAAGCEYKPLEYEFDYAGKGILHFDWRLAPEADPEYMVAVFHDGPSRDPQRFDLPGRLGGSFRIRPGLWTPVAYNGDAAMLFKGDDRADGYIAHTRATSIQKATKIESKAPMPRSKAVEGEPVIVEPDAMWFGMGLPMNLPANADPLEQTITMEPRTLEIEIIIRHVPNLRWTTQFGGSLSGLAAGVHCSTGEPLAEPATEAFYMYSPDDSTLVARIRAFGICPPVGGEVMPNHLVTYVVLGDGTKWYYIQDVTEALRSAPYDEELRLITLIVDNGVPIPAPVTGDSGFQPTIDDWVGVDIALSMKP